MYVIYLSVILLVIFLFKYLTTNDHFQQIGNRIPGPKTVPGFGNALLYFTSEVCKEYARRNISRNNLHCFNLFLGYTLFGGDYMVVLYRLKEKYGNIFRFWLGPVLYVILNDPEDVEVLLNNYKHITKAVSYDYIRSWLGMGLITSEGDLWYSHRKLLTPTFHFKILEHAVVIMNKHGHKLVKQLQKEVDAEEFNVHKYVEKCSLDTICDAAMGIDMNVQSGNETKYLKAVKNVTNISVSRIFKVWLQPDFIFKLLPISKLFEESRQILNMTSKKVIVSKKNMLTSELESEEAAIKYKKQKHIPFLDCLLLENSLSDNEIQDEVQSFMFAGHDTTTAGISFCLYLISNHQDVQERLYEEIMDVVPNNQSLLIADINKCKYLENVVKESLRLYPPVPMIARWIKEDFELPSGYLLPAGTQVNIFIHSLHRNPAIFKYPEEFNPDRFLDLDDRNPFSYIPFSAGPRNCIGQRLALLDIKILVILILKKYRLLPASKTKKLDISSELILRSKNGVPIKLIHRS